MDVPIVSIDKESLAQHATALSAAIRLLSAHAEEEQRATLRLQAQRGGKSSLAGLRQSLTGALALLRETPLPTELTWQPNPVQLAASQLHEAPLRWNSQPGLARSIDGKALLIVPTLKAADESLTRHIVVAIIWVATIMVFEQQLARTYQLTTDAARALVMHNPRAQPLLRQILQRLAAQNAGSWWDYWPSNATPEGSDRQPLPDGLPSLGHAWPTLGADLPLYTPHGERIDLFAVVGSCRGPTFRQVASEFDALGTPEALSPLYELP